MNFIKYILFTIAALFFIQQKSIAQTNNNFSVQYLWLCDATNTTFYRVLINRPGKDPYVWDDFTPDQVQYNPTGAISVGPCSLSDTVLVNSADSSYQFLGFEMCDDSLTTPVNFIRVFKYATKISSGVKVRQYVTDFKSSDGTTYTPSTQYYSGTCGAVSIDTGTKVIVLQATNTSGTILQSTCNMGINILNVGPDTAQITVNSVTYDLLINESWFCDAVFNEMTKKVLECPAVTYNCTVYGSTTLHITKRSK